MKMIESRTYNQRETTTGINNGDNNRFEHISEGLRKLLNWEVESIELNPNVQSKLKLEFQEKLDSKIVWQEESKKALINAVVNNIWSLRKKPWPLWVFFFAWPSWVGKTESVRALAEMLLGSPEAFTKIECEEYQESHTARNLFGSPKSYVGYWDPTPLCDIKLFKPYNKAKEKWKIHPRIRYYQNFAILLFDEIEKANPEIHQSLLSVLDEWKIKFSTGKEDNANRTKEHDIEYSETTDLSNTIIVLTSNVGSHKANTKKSVWFIWKKEQDKEKIYKDEFKKIFSTEFRWRIEEMVVFNQLSKSDIFQILQRELEDINWHIDVLWGNIRIEVEDEVLKKITEKAYSTEYGARPAILEFRNTVEKDINKIVNSWQIEELYELWNYHFVIHVDLDSEGGLKYNLKKVSNNNIAKELIADELTRYLFGYIKSWFDENTYQIKEVDKILKDILNLSDEQAQKFKEDFSSNIILNYWKKKLENIHKAAIWQYLNSPIEEIIWREKIEEIINEKVQEYENRHTNSQEYTRLFSEIIDNIEDLVEKPLTTEEIEKTISIIDSHRTKLPN